MKLYLDGTILEDDGGARIPPADRGFLYGDGIFETLRVRAGRIEFLEGHVARLLASAAALALPIAMSGPAIASALCEVASANGGGDLALRLTVTRGTGGSRLDVTGSEKATVLITAAPHPAGGGLERPDGLRLATCPFPRNERSPLCGHKTLNALESILARSYARAAGADEALLRNTAGRLAEAAAANVFLVSRGILRTPSLEEGALPGIVRGAVLRAARDLGLDSREEPIAYDEIAESAEVFVTNSLLGLARVLALDGRPLSPIPPGDRSAWVHRLRDRVREIAGSG